MNKNNPEKQSISVRDRTLDLSSPKIMGILNATPDSFSDGGNFNEVEAALGRIGLMISQGAHIIDVGGESTRPGSEPVTEQQELDRVVPILKKAISQFPDTFFSIDTTKYRVAEEALKLGTHFVNDVSGLQKEPRFLDLCVQHNAGYVMMHSQGNPKTMQKDPAYDDVVTDIKQYLKKRIDEAKERGLNNIIIDPGIGFGKTLDHNLKLIADLKEFQDLGCPILIGASRKSMIGQILNDRPVDDRLTGTIAVHYHAMLNGANIIRVHDVKEAHDSLQVFNAITSVE
ncbi:dihydropteroate synthase [Fodinibius sp. AD559]|uniref:dihydropteroate synthase n=1 Tax=Fodinibius sp. AD559 TaxID=3424179 RepID=UPI004046AC0D